MSEAGTNRLRASLVPMACLVAVAVMLSPVRPFPLLAVPFALFLVALRPRDLFGLATAVVLLALVFRVNRQTLIRAGSCSEAGVCWPGDCSSP